MRFRSAPRVGDRQQPTGPTLSTKLGERLRTREECVKRRVNHSPTRRILSALYGPASFGAGEDLAAAVQ